MSYRSGGYKSPFIGVGVVVGALVALFFGLRGLALVFNANGIGVQTPQSVEKMLFANADTGEIYRTLKRTYPQEYDALTADILRHLKAGESYAKVDQMIATELHEAERNNRKDMVQSPDDRLDAFRRAEIKIVEMLRDTDPGLCATYVMTGQVRTRSPGPFTKPLVAYRITALEAAAAGRDHPAGRKIAAPTAPEVRELARMMVLHGATEHQVQSFLVGTAGVQLSTVDQCQVGLYFYRTVDDMAAGQGDKLYAYLLSRNL